MPLLPLTPKQITAGYAEMAARYQDEGWTPYLLTFMFRQLPGSPARVARQMEREVERVYGRFVTRVVRNPRSALAVGHLPVWIASPDFPVFKHEKRSLEEVTVNEGRHMHAVDLQPPRTRLRVGVDKHFDEAQSLYVGEEFSLARVHAVPITHDLKKVVGYALKALLNRRVDGDATLILPRSQAEVGTHSRSTMVGRI